MIDQKVSIDARVTALKGSLVIPSGATGIVIFAHGSGSSHLSPRNRYVASQLNKAKIGTLLFDLLTPEEEKIDMQTAQYRFDIEFLAKRLIDATKWVLNKTYTKNFSLGYFGASTGAAASLVAASELPAIRAIVSRGGRPDLAELWLQSVRAATLLIVGSRDTDVLSLNQQTFLRLKTKKSLQVIPEASHLFEESGALEKVASLARDWFLEFL